MSSTPSTSKLPTSSLSPHLSLCLTILPYSLYLISFTKTNLHKYTYHILKLLTNLSSLYYYSYIENDNDITIITTSVGINIAEFDVVDKDLTISATVWKSIIISEGVNVECNIINIVSKICKDNNISILYLSSYNIDYVLVLETEVDKVVNILESNLSILKDVIVDNEFEKIQAIESKKLSELIQRVMLDNDRELVLSPIRLDRTKSDLSELKLSLYLLPSKIILKEYTLEYLLSNMSYFINLFFFIKDYRFFAAIYHNDALCIINTVNKTESVDEQVYRALQVQGEFGFYETGLVYSLSEPIAQANIPVVYISTYKTDFIMVEECRLEETKDRLKSKFEVKE